MNPRTQWTSPGVPRHHPTVTQYEWGKVVGRIRTGQSTKQATNPHTRHEFHVVRVQGYPAPLQVECNPVTNTILGAWVKPNPLALMLRDPKNRVRRVW